MVSAVGHHGVPNEVLFEQRTPSTLRGTLNITLQGGAADTISEQPSHVTSPRTPSRTSSPLRSVTRASFPRSVMWRLRIGDGSTMLCSKLCGILTVNDATEKAEDLISITLPVRAQSSFAGESSASDAGHASHGLPPLAVPPTVASSVPSWVRKTSRLKIQWVELSQNVTPRQHKEAVLNGNAGVTLDIATALKALQSAKQDRTLLESMFRVAGKNGSICHVDVGCTFSDAPLSSRGTSRFSSIRSSSPHPIPRENSSKDFTTPTSSPMRTRDVPSRPSTEDLSETRQGPARQRPFWVGFVVGLTFGATAVLTLLGQSKEAQSVAINRARDLKQLIADGVGRVSRSCLELTGKVKATTQSGGSVSSR